MKRANELQPERDYFMDNLKAYLLVLVIFGHVVTSLRPVKEITNLYYFVYTFHMPCFAFTSGYLAKGIMKNGKFRADRYFSVLWLYVFFRVTQYLVAKALGQSMSLKLFYVGGAPWYLLALASWYLLVPLLLSMKARTGVAVTTLAALLIGYLETEKNYFAIPRTVAFLPFFAIGLYLTKEGLAALLDKKLRIPSFFVFVGSAACFAFAGHPYGQTKNLVFATTSYAGVLGELAPYGFFIRGGLFLFAFVLCVAMMYLVPRKKMWFSYVGQYSLTVYILHVLVRDTLKYTGFFDWVKKLPKPYMWLSVPLCVIAALILGNPLFGRVMNRIANPFQRKRKG